MRAFVVTAPGESAVLEVDPPMPSVREVVVGATVALRSAAFWAARDPMAPGPGPKIQLVPR